MRYENAPARPRPSKWIPCPMCDGSIDVTYGDVAELGPEECTGCGFSFNCYGCGRLYLEGEAWFSSTTCSQECYLDVEASDEGEKKAEIAWEERQ